MSTAITRTAAYGRFEGLRLVRNSGFIGPAVIIPTVMYLVFTRLGDNAGKADVASYLMVSMACFGAVGAALSNGLSAIEERELDWLRQLRTTPLPPLGMVIARAVLGVLAAIPPIAVVLLVGGLVNSVRLSPGQWATTAGVLIVGATPFALLGVAIGYGAKTQLAQQLSMLLNLGLALIGGLWIPANNFPTVLARISSWTPTSAYAGLGRAAGGIRSLAAGDVATLSAWTLGFLVLAVLVCSRAVRNR